MAKNFRVVGFGASILDYVASVQEYPKADAKIRTTAFETQGGGNCGNTLTCLKRLGIPTCVMVTKVGTDPVGQQTMQLMEKEGIDTSKILIKKGGMSAFTYVIVDEKDKTRTCIHTPAEEYFVSDLSPSLLDGADLLHLDGRHTEAAVQLGTWANERRIPVVLDVEKDRPFLGVLLTKADYIVTSTGFPRELTGIHDGPLEAAMHQMLHMCGRAKVLVTTRGSLGSTMMVRSPRTPPDSTADPQLPEGNQWPTPSLLDIDLGSQPPVSINRSRHPAAPTPSCDHEPFLVLDCSSWPIKEAIVDTTGAGDAFIGAFIYGVLMNMAPAKVLALASFVAGRKCTAAGARKGLPYSKDLPPVLR